MELVQTFFNWNVLYESFPELISGLVNTLLLGTVCIIIGTLSGIALCLVRLYAPRPVQLLAIAYIDIFRALPILVLLILIFYALPNAGIRLGAFAAATTALSMVLAAFTAEVCRAGIETIPRGQFEASAALGLHFWQTMHKVILPQAIRIIIPPLTSNSVSMYKDTALAYVVTMPDLLKMADGATARLANPTPLVGAALIYLAFLWPLVRLVGYVEKRSRATKY